MAGEKKKERSDKGKKRDLTRLAERVEDAAQTLTELAGEIRAYDQRDDMPKDKADR